MVESTRMILAPAKINLALAVGPPEPSDTRHIGKAGWHPIASWFAAIELADDVVLSGPAIAGMSDYAIEWAPDAPRRSSIDWPIEKDLAVRAHRALEVVVERALPITMTVRKRIPVGGGLGGGSSDAAAALIGINAFFDLGLGAADLRAIGQTLGSDVAFFLDERRVASACGPRAALVTGFGETIERLELAPGVHGSSASVILVMPPVGCPTGAVYQAFDRSSPRALQDEAVRALAEGWRSTGVIAESGLFNDLTMPACVVTPEMWAMRERVARLAGPARVHVTGSGSTMFVLEPDEDAARALARRISAVEPSARVVVSKVR
jgi:4-diphosphocytidyl-2-C-methyl-D-erythritol kinase